MALDAGVLHSLTKGTPGDAWRVIIDNTVEIASKPPVVIWGTKQAVHYARDHTVDEALKQMGWLQAAMWSNRHVGVAVRAFQGKRTGNYPDLAELKSFTDLA